MLKETRTTQVEVIVFKIVDKQILFLLLKRNPERGGFWQPITGGVHNDEPLLNAAQRELKEETNITNYIKIYSDIYYFEFQSEGYGILKEYVFGVQIAPETNVKISSEHTDMQWCDFTGALELLKYESNKTALQKLYSLIKT
jgi:dATP pyrophosphohydrolase